LRAIAVGLLALCMALPWGEAAHAALLKAVRPGVMCSSAAALAKLTLHNGNSRSALPGASPRYRRIAAAGGCIALRKDMIVTAEAIRKNTSIVTYHPYDGIGEGRFYVPNIDFVRFTPPDTIFYREIRRHCPRKLDGIYVYDHIDLADMQNLFIASLPKSMQDRIAASVHYSCKADQRCVYRAEARAESRLHLDARHADFLCRLKGFPSSGSD
jgi:hypothetical protein